MTTINTISNDLILDAIGNLTREDISQPLTIGEITQAVYHRPCKWDSNEYKTIAKELARMASEGLLVEEVIERKKHYDLQPSPRPVEARQLTPAEEVEKVEADFVIEGTLLFKDDGMLNVSGTVRATVANIYRLTSELVTPEMLAKSLKAAGVVVTERKEQDGAAYYNEQHHISLPQLSSHMSWLATHDKLERIGRSSYRPVQG